MWESLIDVDLTERDGTLSFVWARMHYIDEQHDKSRSEYFRMIQTRSPCCSLAAAC